MNLQQIILTLSIVSPSFLCMGMEQSHGSYINDNLTLGYTEQELQTQLYNHLWISDNQSLLPIRPSKVLPRINQPSKILAIVEAKEQRAQNVIENTVEPSQILPTVQTIEQPVTNNTSTQDTQIPSKQPYVPSYRKNHKPRRQAHIKGPRGGAIKVQQTTNT